MSRINDAFERLEAGQARYRIVLDLKHEVDRETFLKLVAKADVVVLAGMAAFDLAGWLARRPELREPASRSSRLKFRRSASAARI